MRLLSQIIMIQAPQAPTHSLEGVPANPVGLSLQLPNPQDEELPELEFQRQIETAWSICDRFDLDTDIWRGRILRAVRDREKQGGEQRGSGFLNWLKDREISKSRAYQLIELANSADTLLESGHIAESSVECFSKQAFLETAQASEEVQQLVGEAARRGERITRREVRQLADEWTAMTSDLLPQPVREKVADNTIPSRYVAPLVKELAKLPEIHQVNLQEEVAANPELDTLRQVTAEARNLTKYLQAFSHVQALSQADLNLELALEEAMRIGCLNVTADLVNQAAQLEQAIARLYMAWRRVRSLSEKLYVDSGASTPHLRSLLGHLENLSGEFLEVNLGDQNLNTAQTIQLHVMTESKPGQDGLPPL